MKHLSYGQPFEGLPGLKKSFFLFGRKSYLLLCLININPITQISIKMTTELTTPAMIGIRVPSDEKFFCSTDSGRYRNMI